MQPWKFLPPKRRTGPREGKRDRKGKRRRKAAINVGFKHAAGA
jgi:hypothetical protein